MRFTVERRRGSRWVAALRAIAPVKRSGRFAKDVPRLPRGAYRVRGAFLGTGTAQPSRPSGAAFRV